MDVVKVLEPFAVNREQENHKEALMTFGEKVTIRRIWTVNDFEAGLVARCAKCSAGDTDDLRDRYQAVYKQSGSTYCPGPNPCYGTGFEGGFRPILYIAYALVTDQLEDWKKSRTGEFTPAKPSIQFMWEPHLQEYDLCSRFERWDGDAPVHEFDRFVLREIQPVTLRTGPRKPRPEDPLTGGAVGVIDGIFVAQQCQMDNLPQEHPLKQVVMVP